MKTVTSVLFVLIAVISVSAGIRPSFILEGSAWRATDIVVVTEDKQIDGVFKILETWKGDLKPGETITIPEMEEFKSKEARLIHSWDWVQQKADPAEYVTCERMILFLRDAQKIPEGEDEDDRSAGVEKSTSRWQSANPMGDEVKYSTVWIENGKLHWFVQIINPGPSLLVPVKTTEAELKSEVSHVLNTQNNLNAALAVPDLKTRAEGLEPFAQDSLSFARRRAFAGLTECGEAALPVLRRMLDNELLSQYRGDVIQSFAKAGGRSVGPELTAWLEKELQFWKKTGPTLQVGWWNGAGFGEIQSDAIKAVDPLRDRYGVMYHAIYALGETRYTGAERVLNELNDFWRSLPQLYELSQMSEACDEVLRNLGSNRKGGEHPIPKYEVVFSGNKAFSSTLLREKMAEYVKAYDEVEELEDSYGSDMFDYAQSRLMDFIASQGYLNVRFSGERGGSERGERILMRIDEGKQYRLGKIQIEGAKLFSPDQIRAKLNLREGEIADGEAIHNWMYKDLEKTYHDLGYLQCEVEQDYEYRAKSKGQDLGIADLKLTIDEGPQYKIGSIKFEGKTKVQADQLSAAMLLREGEAFSQKQLDDSIDELNKLGLNLDRRKDVSVDKDKTQPLVDIVIFLNKDRPVDDPLHRFKIKHGWYR
jgi:surface antigen-like variable number repeat protein